MHLAHQMIAEINARAAAQLAAVEAGIGQINEAETLAATLRSFGIAEAKACGFAKYMATAEPRGVFTYVQALTSDGKALRQALRDADLRIQAVIEDGNSYSDIHLDVRGVEAVAEEIVVEIPSLYRRNDAEIAEAALYALKWDATVPHERLKVKVENGWITLTGDLEWGYQKTAAEKAVRNLHGVRGVYDLITTRPHADPNSVKKEISRLLHKNIERDLEHIMVETHEGTVELRGSVSSWAEKQDATKAAWNTPGVSKVENYITING